MCPAYNSLRRRSDSESTERSSVLKLEKFVLSAALIANVLSFMALSITCLIYIQGLHHTAATPPDSSAPIVCIACMKLRNFSYDSTQSNSLISNLTIRLENGVQMCCAHNSGQISAIMELSMQKVKFQPALLPEYDPKDFSFSPVSAHKRLYPSIVMTNLTVPFFETNKLVATHLDADNNDYLIEHARGVDVLKEGFRILQSGMYLIYSSIHFRPESVYPCKSFKFQTWGHYVERVSPDLPKPTDHILQTAHTCCDQCSGDDETSFTSGMFYLRSGDVIRVSVSGHGLVYFRKQSSFAGLMMVSNGDPDNEDLLTV